MLGAWSLQTIWTCSETQGVQQQKGQFQVAAVVPRLRNLTPVFSLQTCNSTPGWQTQIFAEDVPTQFKDFWQWIWPHNHISVVQVIKKIHFLSGSSSTYFQNHILKS